MTISTWGDALSHFYPSDGTPKEDLKKEAALKAHIVRYADSLKFKTRLDIISSQELETLFGSFLDEKSQKIVAFKNLQLVSENKQLEAENLQVVNLRSENLQLVKKVNENLQVVNENLQLVKKVDALTKENLQLVSKNLQLVKKNEENLQLVSENKQLEAENLQVVKNSVGVDATAQKIQIATLQKDLQFRDEKIEALRNDLRLLQIGAGQKDSALSGVKSDLENAKRENLEREKGLKLAKSEKANLETIKNEVVEKLKVYQSKESDSGRFVSVLTNRYNGLFVTIGYLSFMAMFVVGIYEFKTFCVIFDYLKIPFAWSVSIGMVIFFQGKFVDDIGATCFNIALFGYEAKTKSEKILNGISVTFGVSIVILMFLTGQRIWNEPQPAPQFDANQIQKISEKYRFDSARCVTMFARDSAKLTDSIGFHNERRVNLSAKSWCKGSCQKTYIDSNSVATAFLNQELRKMDCKTALQSIEMAKSINLSQLKPLPQIDNRFFGLFVYLLFVFIRIVEIVVKVIRVNEGIEVKPKRLREIVFNFIGEIKKRI
jgi:hypothetical protein